MTAETVLQFGSGRFLRAFADLFIHHANAPGSGRSGGWSWCNRPARAAPAGSTPRAGATTSASAATRTAKRWTASRLARACRGRSRRPTTGRAVLELATSRDLKTVLSNTTEAGYALDAADVAPTPGAPAPASFPAKLLAVLAARHRAGLPGVTVIPCELLEGNAKLLRETVLTLAANWGMSPALADYVSHECVWLHTLVDRIVTGGTGGPPGAGGRTRSPAVAGAVRVLGFGRPSALAIYDDAPRDHPRGRRGAVLFAQGADPQRGAHGVVD